MRSTLLPCLAVLVAGCGSSHELPPPKRPNTELIVGAYERHPPGPPTAMRFDPGGAYVVAKDKAGLDSTPVAKGTFTLDGDQLALTPTSGPCSATTGTYKVVISKIGIHFAKVEDACEDRKLDGQTWWRVK